MKIYPFLLFCCAVVFSCAEKPETNENLNGDPKKTVNQKPQNFPPPPFTVAQANKLIALPLHCVTTQYPNKLGQTIGAASDLQQPSELHPLFYGCFDWHSAVHGYWSMVVLLKQFPQMEAAKTVEAILNKNITPEKVAAEVAYFQKELNKNYERTYGWAWLLKLAGALHTWDSPQAKKWAENLQPLTRLIAQRYIEFLPKLVYPIRVGEHTNTAFGLAFAHDYARAVGNDSLKTAIENRARHFFNNDTACPIAWEPSGYDFLSPCLEEVDMMRRTLPKNEFLPWLQKFQPELLRAGYTLPVAEVSDRTDGKLVHLDGLNFSRAWVLYGLADQYPQYAHLKNMANRHLAHSYPNLIGDSYEGGHWLGSFAIYALMEANRLK
ncbi:MAG: DUF2891 domain-containing protein [Marinirhabdus sp.]